MSEKYLGQEQKQKRQELTFHLLIGLLGELEPLRIPHGHDVGLPLLLTVGLLELHVLLPESADVSPQPPLGDLRAILGLGCSSDLGLELLPQLVQLSLQAGSLTPRLLDLTGIRFAGILLALQGLGQLIFLR